MHFPRGSSPRRQRDLAQEARELVQLQRYDYSRFVQRVQRMVSTCITKVITEKKPIDHVLDSFNAKIQLCRNSKEIGDYADNTVRHSEPVRIGSHRIVARAREIEIVQHWALEKRLRATPGAEYLLLRLMIEKGMQWSDAAKKALEICKLSKNGHFVPADPEFSIKKTS